MKKIFAFVKLDFLTVKPYITLKNLLILIIVPLFMGYSSPSDVSMIGFIMVFGALFVSYPFAVSEKNGLDSLYATLAITRGTVVFGRYLFSFILNICTGFLGYFLTFMLSAVLKRPFSPSETFFIILAIFAIYSLVLSFQLPIYFKLGYAKAKMIAYLPFVAWPLVVWGLSFLLKNAALAEKLSLLPFWFESHLFIFSLLCLTLWTAIMFSSYRVAFSYYQKRDF